MDKAKMIANKVASSVPKTIDEATLLNSIAHLSCAYCHITRLLGQFVRYIFSKQSYQNQEWVLNIAIFFSKN